MYMNKCKISCTNDTFGVPYVGKPSHTFSKQLRALIKNKFHVDTNIFNLNLSKLVITLKLKCSTPTELSSNIVYKFSCPCDMAISYIGRLAI